MNILLIGAGGRENAFSLKISQSKHCTKLFIAPGNAGTAQFGQNLPIDVLDFEAVKAAVISHQITFVVIGPEEPLVRGIHDFFLADPALAHIPVIGPKKDGAQLEGSKDFSKNFMHKYGIPTASSHTFTIETLPQGMAYLQNHSLPIVLKADGLAAGKGVLICTTVAQAQAELTLMLAEAKFGKASAKVVVEEFLHGIELSVFVVSDGQNYVILPEAKDYKRIGEGDKGLNTGGMGAISPVHFADAAFMKKVEETVIIPTINGLRQEGIHYKGFIFIGLMNDNGQPSVVEYNCRMGDPETESVLPRIESDFLELLMAVADEKVADYQLIISPKTAATIMLVSAGYPGEYITGKTITGLENLKDSTAFHAGTVLDNGLVKTNGGRVLAITSLQPDLFTALQQATADAGRVYYDGVYFRRDIGFDLL
ncbi:MAG: phosphoribosylamine--glycine ligase [Sphingobacteriales bacterium]|nr:MAG: phosphoribosylamine--glycine ligase [Sphingobacteriales bacterium]